MDVFGGWAFYGGNIYGVWRQNRYINKNEGLFKLCIAI